MADGKFLIGKPSGGVTTVSLVDGASNTNLVLPESGTVATQSYVDSKTFKDVNYKLTPVSITSWSYSGTTITLNVVSHTFISGDYIEIAGLTATTYPANGIQLVTSVTATTIVFTLGTTPTGTAGVSSATVKGYATVNGRVSEGIGVNQNYSTFTALSGVTYYNTSGKPVMKIGKVTATGAGTIYIAITVGGAVVCERNLYVSAAGYSVTAEALVPAGASYVYTISARTFSSATQLI